MKIGILELLSENAQKSWVPNPHDYFVVKQYASIMPQAISGGVEIWDMMSAMQHILGKKIH